MITVSLMEQQVGSLIPNKTINDIVEAIINHFNPISIILFGSYASGNATPDSDLDLLIVMETRLPSYKRSLPIRKIFNPMPCAMDIKVYTPEEIKKWNGTINHIITEAMLKGKILYERQ